MTAPEVTVLSRPAVVPIVALALLGLLPIACAASSARRPEDQRPSSALSDADCRAVEGAEQAMRQAEGELASSKAAAVPDCARACELATNVCALAERICAIAARTPADERVSAQCADGRARCAHAAASVAGPCSCEKRATR